MSGLNLIEISDFAGSETVGWTDTVIQAYYIVTTRSRRGPSQKYRYFYQHQWAWSKTSAIGYHLGTPRAHI